MMPVKANGGRGMIKKFDAFDAAARKFMAEMTDEEAEEIEEEAEDGKNLSNFLKK